MKKLFLLFLLSVITLLPSFAEDLSIPVTPAEIDSNFEKWEVLGENLNNSFFYVLEIIDGLQIYFKNTAYLIARIVFLIAICLAAINYALTGSGLKENLIKIGKSTIFFIIIMVGYSSIIGWIASFSFNLANESLGKKVQTYFEQTTYKTIEKLVYTGSTVNITAGWNSQTDSNDIKYNGTSATYRTIYASIPDGKRDSNNLFGKLTTTRFKYQVMQPGALLRIIFFVAGECFNLATKENQDTHWFNLGKVITNGLKGLVVAFFVVATGIFATIEYLVCFLEFMLVTSVGIILFPFTIWEGSKFWAEKFVGAVLGFFIKLLFVTLAIFIMCYGYINMFYFVSDQSNAHFSFSLEVGEIIFIAFSSILFFFICKSAPGIAQGLLTGTPSLSASGAISAVSGAVGGALAVGGMAKAAAKTGAKMAGGAALHAGGALLEAGASAKSATGGLNKVKAFGNSLGKSAVNTAITAGHSLTRSLFGVTNTADNNTSQIANLRQTGSMRKHLGERINKGTSRGKQFQT